jgi:TRAP-type C4-dicarboxylate transport system substrate-binding protein
MTVNLDAWNKLKPEHQKAIEELAKKLEPDFWATSIAADTESNNKLKAQGMELVPIPAPMMAELRARTKNLLEDFIKRVPISEKPLRAYLAEMKRN